MSGYTHRLAARSRGFTLVEVIIALSVTGFLILIIMNFMADNLVTSTVQSARADLLHEAQQALDRSTSDIRLSASADDANRWPDDHAPSAPADKYSWHSSSSVLILATAVQDSDRNILFEDANKYITYKNNLIYFVQNGTLYRRTLAAPIAGNSARQTCPASAATAACPADKALLHDVTAFTVRYRDGQDDEVTPSDARSIELSVTLQTKKYGHVVKADYTTRTVFRND